MCCGGMDVMQGAIAAAEALGSRLFRPAQLATLAGAHAKLGDCPRALGLLEEAIELAHRTGEKQALAGIQRVQRRNLIQPRPRQATGEAALRAASHIARTQCAISEERRIEAALARLLSAAARSRTGAEPAPADTGGWLGMFRSLLGI